MFALEFVGDGESVLCAGVASEWFLFRVLRRASKARRQIVWFESAGRPLTSRALDGLNVYLRSGAMRFFRGRVSDYGDEMLSWGDWCRFCRMLGLTFDGEGTGPDKEKPARHFGRKLVRFPFVPGPRVEREARDRDLLWAIQPYAPGV